MSQVLPKFLHFFVEKSSMIFFSKFVLYIKKMIWISRISFDP